MAEQRKSMDEVRAQVNADTAKAAEALAPYYVGRQCPLFQSECKGPHCAFFLQVGEQDPQTGRHVITAGHCSVPLLASQFGPIGAGLTALAEGAARMQSGSVIGSRG